MVRLDTIVCIGALYGVFQCIQDSDAFDPVTVATAGIGVVSGVLTITEFIIQRYRDFKSPDEAKKIDNRIKADLTLWNSYMTESKEAFISIQNSLNNQHKVLEFFKSMSDLRDSFTVIYNDFRTTVDRKFSLIEDLKMQGNLTGTLKSYYRRYALDKITQYNNNGPFERLHNVLRDTFKNYSESHSTFLDQYQEKHANVCMTGMSPLQAISKLLEHVAWVSSHYYYILVSSYDMKAKAKGKEYDKTIESRIAGTTTKLWDETIDALSSNLKKFSRELYVCNTPDITKDGSFHELKVFSKAFLRNCHHVRPHLDLIFQSPEKECASIKDFEFCPEESESDDIEKNCILAHSSCMSVHDCGENYFWDNAGVCVREPSKEPSTDQRYEYYYKSHEHEDFASMNQNAKCNDVSLDRKKYVISERECKTCQCICQDREYWVNIEPAKPFTSENEVVTGAKIVLRNNILEVHIQRGKLLPNGIIDSTISPDTTPEERWVGPTKNTLKKISWESLRRFHLSTWIADPGFVVTAMGFDIAPLGDPDETIYLKIYASQYYFREGSVIISGISTDTLYPRYPTTFSFTDLDVADSTSPMKVKGKSSEVRLDARVKLATSDGIDGGRSTVPFFDGQGVTANSPLSGAGLYWKGKNGTGGFIGIRLITYGTAPFITNDPDAV